MKSVSAILKSLHLTISPHLRLFFNYCINNMNVEDFDHNKNFSHIQKYAILADIQSSWDHVHNRMSDRGWRPICDRFHKSENAIREVWAQYQRERAQRGPPPPEEILKPKKKARHDSHPNTMKILWQL
jgi:hypothetical protein